MPACPSLCRPPPPNMCVAQVELEAKASAYLAVLTGRSLAYAFFMLRANAARKRRSRAARLRHLAGLRRRALQGWRERLLRRKVMESRLGGVFRKARGFASPFVCICVLGTALPGRQPCFASRYLPCRARRMSCRVGCVAVVRRCSAPCCTRRLARGGATWRCGAARRRARCARRASGCRGACAPPSACSGAPWARHGLAAPHPPWHPNSGATGPCRRPLPAADARPSCPASLRCTHQVVHAAQANEPGAGHPLQPRVPAALRARVEGGGGVPAVAQGALDGHAAPHQPAGVWAAGGGALCSCACLRSGALLFEGVLGRGAV